ncbi:hypothetical protein [Rhizobium mesoamericanum]|uniref:Uncharacterized protein n=1 Tax=Rhizobium mesoamericanum STM3625 TaxID=1211777 RepID=K0PL15_9HYPH|nr:hypothetical protein [Rhizobium mesoamericanum]CCM77131.1 hypothetical protein BN77_4181 [Rhizobium mesoamericanum STM3625]
MVSPKTQFLDWDTTASANTEINNIGIQGTNAVSNFDDAFRTLMAQLRSGVDGKAVYAAKSGNYTAVANDNNAVLRFTANATLSLTAAATLATNWHITVIAQGGDVTIDPNSSETINGATTLLVKDGQTAIVVCNGTAFFAQVVGAVTSGIAIQGKLFGLTLSNNVSDATNDIDIAAGSAASDTSPYYLMTLAAGITKRLDAAWAVGTNQGGLDTGSPANTSYFVWLIQRSDTGVVDVLFSASSTSPTMPTNYDRKRRIGAIIRESAAIVAFKQVGNVFKRAPAVSLNSTSAVASTLVSLAVPVGIVVQPILNSFMQIPAAASASNLIGDAAVGSANTTIHQLVSNFGTTEVNAERVTIPGGFFTDTSGNIYFARVITSGSITTNTMTVLGWIDDRGQNV